MFLLYMYAVRYRHLYSWQNAAFFIFIVQQGIGGKCKIVLYEYFCFSGVYSSELFIYGVQGKASLGGQYVIHYYSMHFYIK